VGRTGYGALLARNRNFRFLWAAEIVSFLGDWFNTIALYTIVFELAGSGRALAVVMVAKMLPVFLVMPVAGPLVDRFDRRTLLIASDLARMVLALGLILAHRAESLPALYACIVAMVTMTGVFFPARQAAIPQIVGEKDLATANALSGGTWSVMLAIGAAAGGWVTAAAGVDVALVLDSATFLLSAGLLVTLPALPAPAARRGASVTFVDGLRHLRRHPYQMALACLKPMMALGGGTLILIPVLGSGFFPATSGPLWVGILYSSRGLGALIGSIGMFRVFGESSRTLRRMILCAYPLAGLAYLALGRVTTFAGAAACLFVAAVGSGMNWVMVGTLLQRDVDRHYLGRVSALEFGVMTLVFSGMSWIAGGFLDSGVPPSSVATRFGFLLFVPFVAWGVALVLFRERRLRDATGDAVLTAGTTPEAFDAIPPAED
jgi:MFS family permease